MLFSTYCKHNWHSYCTYWLFYKGKKNNSIFLQQTQNSPSGLLIKQRAVIMMALEQWEDRTYN